MLQRLLKETLIGFRSSPLLSVLSIVTVAFTLFLIGLFVLLYANINQIIVDMGSRVALVAYLKDDTPRSEIEKIKADLYQRGEIKSVRLITKEEALSRFQDELGEESTLLQGLATNPLPQSIEVDFKEEQLSEEVVMTVAKIVGADEYVESVDYGGAWLSKLQLVKTMVAVIGSVGAAVLLAVALVIIGSAIRMTVYSRKTELLVMKLVGSTDWTIKGPFLVEGLVKGGVGGVLAAVLSYFVYNVVDHRLIGLVAFPIYYNVPMVATGIVLCVGGTYLSVTGQLRKLW